MSVFFLFFCSLTLLQLSVGNVFLLNFGSFFKNQISFFLFSCVIDFLQLAVSYAYLVDNKFRRILS